jgi:hypothetical protein
MDSAASAARRRPYRALERRRVLVSTTTQRLRLDAVGEIV